MTKKASRVFVGCNCIKSRCTKNYCECFTQGISCLTKPENAANYVSAQAAKTKENHRRNTEQICKSKKLRGCVIARNQIV